ncbi:hypothetical protein [Clostridium sp. JNZ J1-5]
MKALKRIIIWILISLIMQVAVLYYVDNYLFGSQGVSGTIVSTKVDKEKEKKKKKADVSIPEAAEHVSVSYDGGYLSYYKDDELRIIDIYTGKEKKVDFEDNQKVSFYKWAPDRNILLISTKKEYNKSSKFLFYSYDAERDEKDKLETKEQEETAFVTNKTSEIVDLQLSPLTNMIYIKTSLKGGRSSIHSINIMKRINEIKTQVYFIGDIKIIPNDDRIAYESLTKNNVYVTGKTKPISIDGVDKLSLLGVDENDMIYVGELEGDASNGSSKIKNIYYGTINDDVSEWKSVKLKDAINKKDAYVTRDGNIYINDNLKGVVTELKSNKDTAYKGIFFQMYDGGVASISDGKLLETELK